MSDPIQCLCVKCQRELIAPFPSVCPHCGFTLDHLSGKKLSDFQKNKKDKHSDLLLGRKIQLYDGSYNASFDSYGDANLEDLIRFTISYGHRIKLTSKGGRHENELIVSFIPEIIGSGVSIYNSTYMPCSGVGIISPASENYGHGFPILESYVHTLGTKKGNCVSCGAPTAFGHPLCQKCYDTNGNDWRNFL